MGLTPGATADRARGGRSARRTLVAKPRVMSSLLSEIVPSSSCKTPHDKAPSSTTFDTGSSAVIVTLLEIVSTLVNVYVAAVKRSSVAVPATAVTSSSKSAG